MIVVLEKDYYILDPFKGLVTKKMKGAVKASSTLKSKIFFITGMDAMTTQKKRL